MSIEIIRRMHDVANFEKQISFEFPRDVHLEYERIDESGFNAMYGIGTDEVYHGYFEVTTEDLDLGRRLTELNGPGRFAYITGRPIQDPDDSETQSIVFKLEGVEEIYG